MAEEGCEPETALPAAMNTSAFCSSHLLVWTTSLEEEPGKLLKYLQPASFSSS